MDLFTKLLGDMEVVDVITAGGEFDDPVDFKTGYLSDVQGLDMKSTTTHLPVKGTRSVQ